MKGTYSVFAADCPWPFKDKLPGNGRGAASHYATMKIPDLCRVFDDLAGMGVYPAESALLFFWYVPAFVEEAVRIVRAWGFTPKSEIVWVKVPSDAQLARKRQNAADNPITQTFQRGFDSGRRVRVGMGRYVRLSHEPCMIATRGRGYDLIRDHGVPSIFFAERGEHSEKPKEFYDLVDRLVVADVMKADLFARAKRKGWHGAGLEYPGEELA